MAMPEHADLSVDDEAAFASAGSARALVIACGALAREIVDFRAANGFEHLDITCLPAKLHNRPHLIPEAVRTKVRANKSRYRAIFVAYGDCGTGGLLDKVIEEEGVERIEGPHCYAFYTGQDAFAAITDDDPTQFFLTDYMVRHFDRLIIEGLGLDRWPELRDDYFGNYTNCVYISQVQRRRPRSQGPRGGRAPRARLRPPPRRLRRARGFHASGGGSRRGSRSAMTRTIVSSATREVAIGFDEPFCIIGERINPTGRKLLMAEMAAGDYSRVERDALAQVAAGAHMLDVNAGVPLADEPRILADCIRLVQSLTDLPLSIDSSIVAALEAGLEVYRGKPLLNSVTGEEERLESVLPLVKKYGCAVVAISNDESGISEDPDERFAIAKKIVERAMDHGIPKEDVVVDPLVMPIGAINKAGVQAFAIMRRLKEELGVNSTCGASNIGFGLPNRPSVNAAFLSMAARSGLTSAIMNPLHEAEIAAVMAADMMNGNDPDCARWLRRFREPAAEGAGEGRRGRREGRRRRREGAAVSA